MVRYMIWNQLSVVMLCSIRKLIIFVFQQHINIGTV
jgi:hypothetical protein